MDNQNRNDSDIDLLEQMSLQTERAVSAGRVCEGCGADLTGRRPQTRFHSNQCRARHHRMEKAGRIHDLITELEQIAGALRKEAEGLS
jgi:hypothetical protein